MLRNMPRVYHSLSCLMLRLGLGFLLRLRRDVSGDFGFKIRDDDGDVVHRHRHRIGSAAIDVFQSDQMESIMISLELTECLGCWHKLTFIFMNTNRLQIDIHASKHSI